MKIYSFNNFIIKIKTHLKWSQNARRGSSHALALDASCRPNRKRYTFSSPTRRLLLYYQAGGRKNLSLPSNSPANEKPLHFKLPVSSNGLFVYNMPSQLPLLHKRTFFPFVLQAFLWFSIDCLFQIAIHHCPQIHPFC